MADMQPGGGFWSRLFSPSARYSVFTLLAAGVAIGAVGLLTLRYVLHATATNEFCSTCHANDAAKEWSESKHHNNRVGFVAGCSDCHLPRELMPMMVRKVKAAKEVWNHFAGKIDTPEKYEAHRKEMAENEWARMRGNRAQECRNCHNPVLSTDKDKAEMHKGALSGGAICIDCHKGVAHKAPG